MCLYRRSKGLRGLRGCKERYDGGGERDGDGDGDGRL